MSSIFISNLEELNSFLKLVEPSLDKDSIDSEMRSFTQLNKFNIPYIFDLAHLSRMSGVSIKQLNFFIYCKNKAYKTFEIPKKSGEYRTIDAPNRKLKYLQRWILENILNKINPGDYAHGFIKNRSIITNSQIHTGKEVVFNLDLENFFPSIAMKRARGFFIKMGYNRKASNILAEICTYRFSLPQGVPTSPMLSNLIAWRLDQRLGKFCHNHELNYTRYADDITISGSSQIPRYKKLIFRIIEDEGFKVNLRKVRLHNKGASQKVTGLTVNDKVSLGKTKKKNFLAMLHNIKNNGPILENTLNNPFFKETILGNISFFNLVDPNFASICYAKFNEINWVDYDKHYNHKGIPNLELRYVKESKNNLLNFKDLEIFKNVKEVPKSHWTKEFLDWLDNLHEKCKDQTQENCTNCIHNPIPGYRDCIKHILSHYTGETGGAHHGHEICDLLANTTYKGKSIFVAFIAKTAKSGKMDRDAKNSLFYQCFDCTKVEEIQVLSVTTNGIIDTRLKLDLIRLLKRQNPNQKLCIIMKEEMAMLLYKFDEDK
jgi:RNA-directed DNA polymerase